uniref:Alpha-tocopherol transfer protein-like n=2 Tax=Cacopsylla melanoneura TaxID=428564 RepID=A0A8D8WR09_9HEMI
MSAHLIPPDDEQKRNIFRSCRILSEDQLKKDAKALREWMRHQPHLPQEVSDITLQTILVQKKNSMEEAKRQIERYFGERNAIPEFFDSQDPLCEDLQSSFDIVYLGICSRMTPQGERITVAKLRDPKYPERFNPAQVVKRITMIADLRIRFEPIEGGEVLVYDFAGATLSHMSQCSPLLGKHMLDVMKIMPMRFKCALFINSPPGLETLIYIVKQFLPEKLQKRIYVYGDDVACLYDHIPRSLLPRDYGGDDMSLDEMTENWRRELVANRDWFLNDSLRRADESKRPLTASSVPRDRFGTQGSFKTLIID